MRSIFNILNFKTQYFDEYTGEPLPICLVRSAMIKEMSYFSEKAIWTAADRADMKSSKDATFVRMMWVLCSKGDLKEPDVRARLVACEVQMTRSPRFTQVSPFLRAKRCCFQDTPHGEPRTVYF